MASLDTRYEFSSLAAKFYIESVELKKLRFTTIHFGDEKKLKKIVVSQSKNPIA